ncbi:ABC transporter substrate-binding protein [Candidatus Solirubrobacter pratensis]|uniref:ABC transporter substrate-binding protein n=1 Tax=Candidatus Solirubrobacter pratensis TaxID=1298857 RepID=UPI00041D7A26|nr:ABC transporter substrate-binding protein [Candidatus Solirubrobacter pratensis]
MQGRTTRLLLGALVVLLAGCGGEKKPAAPANPWTRGDISFGVLAPLQDARGKDLVDGATLAAEDLNIRGGVLGKRVRVRSLDDGCNAASSRASAEQLANQPLGGVLGGICASAASAAARALSLPFLVTSANSPRIVSAKRTPTAYLTNGTPYQAALAAVHFLVLQQARTLATVSASDKASKTLAGQVLGLASPAPKAVSEQTLDPASADYAQIARTAVAAKPDTVYFAGPAEASGKLAAALHEAGFDGDFVASAESESPGFLAAAGEAAEGAFVIAPASPQNLPEAAAWTKRFTTRFKQPPGRDAMLAYDALRALAQAVTQTGKVDPKLNSAQLPKLAESYGGFLGGLQFAADHTVLYDSNIALKVSGGSFKLANALRSAG